MTSQNMTSQNYSSPVITLKGENGVYDALLRMHQNNIKRIVITSSDPSREIPIGIVTESDIVKLLDEDKTTRELDKILLDEIVSKSLVTITEGQEDHMTQCAVRMKTFGINSIVVVNDNGELVGITTSTDLAKSFSEDYLGEYKIKDYMTKKVFTCRKSDSLEFALRSLNKNKISRLVVTDNKGNPIGIITYNTFLQHSEYFKLGSKPKERNYLNPVGSGADLFVSDLMNNRVLTLDQDEDLAKAARLMIEHSISGIPVINKNRNDELVGVVSKTDIIKAFSEVKIHRQLIARDTHFR